VFCQADPSLLLLLLCVAPTPFAGQRVNLPISIPHAKLSLVPSQIIELVAASRPRHPKQPASCSTSALRHRKERTQRRPDEISKESFKPVRDQVFFLFALTKRADHLRVCSPFPHQQRTLLLDITPSTPLINLWA
jgi:hypothetical protein